MNSQNSNNGLISQFLKVFFDLLYHQFSWTYDLVSGIVSLGLWNQWIRSIVGDLPGPRVLELGHGPGHLQQELLMNNIEIFGLDLSPQMGRQAKKRLHRLNLFPNLINGNANELPFRNASFDQVTATFPTEYISDERTIDEIYRVLVPRGRLIILPVAWITDQSFLYRAAALLFEITGQANKDYEAEIVSSIKKAASKMFDFHVETRSLKKSKSLVVIGTKQIED